LAFSPRRHAARRGKINADIQKVFADPDFRETFLNGAMLDPIAGLPAGEAQGIECTVTVIRDRERSKRPSIKKYISDYLCA
jgi:hypothetical protein